MKKNPVDNNKCFGKFSLFDDVSDYEYDCDCVYDYVDVVDCDDDEAVLNHTIDYHKIARISHLHQAMRNLQEIERNYKVVDNKHLQKKNRSIKLFNSYINLPFKRPVAS